MPDELGGDRPIGDAIVAWVARRCDLDPDRVDRDCPLVELGVSSVDAVELAGRLETRLGRPVPPTLLWEHPTVNQIEAALTGAAGFAAAPPPEPAADGPLLAVVGVGCRFPGGADGPSALWQMLITGRDAVRPVPEGRWHRAPGFSPPGGFLDEVARFDAAFFGIAPGEARLMDPQQRLLLEVAWEALAHAALDPAALRGTRTGVYVGISAGEYAHLTTAALDRVEGWTATGAALSIAANRISYLLDLHGPSLAVDTACSSSLVAVHLAARDLRAGDTDLALAGGVNLMLDPALTVAFERAGGLAAGGRCRPFAAEADGIVRGEGCGVVVLKRLTDAVRDGDRVLAVLRGSAVNSDGRSNGLVAPSPRAQEALLRRAYADAGCPPSAVDYVEAHGTGTPLGDPIEAGALGAVLGTGRRPDDPLLIGSVKSHLGHLEAAAGVAGFITAVLALQHGEVPPTLHAERPNPRIPLAGWGLRIAAAGRPLPDRDRPRRVGVSAFGFGGTNAHVVLESAPPPTGSAPAEGPAICVLTDRDQDRVRDQAAALAGWLPDHAGTDPADVAGTLARRGERGTARAAVVCRDTGSLAGALAALADGRSHPALATGDGRRGAERGVWVFAGYGAHWPAMGRHLLDAEPSFAAAVDELEAEFRAECGFGLREGLLDESALPVRRAQPVTFGMQVALAALWRSYGVRPAAVIGHSMGEVAAAVVAGALAPADGIRLINRRAGLLSRVGPGAMAVAELAEEEFGQLADDLPELSVAVVAAPRQLVVTGRPAAVATLTSRAAALGRAVHTLTTEGAGHSAAVDPLLPELRAALRDLRPGEPRLPFYSTVTTDRLPLDAAYWTANLRRPVRLADAVRRAAADGYGFFLEISPHPVLVRPLRATLAEAGVPDPLVTGTLRRDDPSAFDRALATLCAHGHRPPPSPARVLDLPAPPWRGDRHWIDPPPTPEESTRPALLAGLLGVTWQETPGVPDAPASEDGALVVTAPAAGALPDPAEALRFAAAAVAAAATGRRLWLVTCGGAAIGGEAGRPDLAWARGLVRTLAFEQPLSRATWLDLDPAEPPEIRAGRLAAERAADTGDDEVAWQDGRRYVARLMPRPAPARRPGRAVRAGAAYLITGGYGGLGLRVAHWLAAAGAGRLVLAGRSGPSAQARAEIDALTRSGVDVRVVLGDLAAGDTAERVVAAAGDGLAGVVHAAGVLHDGLVSQIDEAALERVWTPKVHGAWRLHRAVQESGAGLDWWVSFSSAAGLLGSPGQAAYAAANAWLDAFASWQRAHGVPASSLAWGTWSEVGGATGVQLPGLDPIRPGDGIAALAGLAAREPVTAGVLHFDPAAALAAFPEAGRLPFFAAVAGGPAPATARPPGQPGGTIEERLAGHLRNVLGEAPPRDIPLIDLGLDSLAAIRIKSLIETDFGQALPTALLVRGATLAEVAGALETPASAVRHEPPDISEMFGEGNGWGASEGGEGRGRAGGGGGGRGGEDPGGREGGGSHGVEARDAAERAAVRLFETVLGRRVPGIDWRAEPGELLRIVEAARREFGVPVKLDAPTPAALAVPLREAEQAVIETDGLTPLRAAGDGPPLFLAHPAGGSTFVYRQLVDLLDGGFPVFGLERLGDGESVPERAARYVGRIRRVWPDGPYRLAGWSFGGVLAYEIGRQLAHDGAEVTTLALIDAGLPIPMPAERAAELLAERFRGFVRYLNATYGTRFRPDEPIERVLDRMQDLLPPAVLRHQVDSHRDTRALDDYRPEGYGGPVTLYRCTRPTPWAVRDPRYEHTDAARGWDRCCTALRIVPVDGHHLNLLDPPAVDTIAADLRRLL
ncbi:type I polyketide synthase [Paractinoplanes rishiriensis]|uniref:Polyketide synthase n=1 Tax=Paractinoplanes rishiriensis TaxID=1050105 RepID=A0A919K2F2_9ACTN|nr:type I polyketide synthase [Actinoplanes rishiriensis]GIE97632.1 hypothetical protein Ari01nite_50970 [Actinoplanes rishiriensis]